MAALLSLDECEQARGIGQTAWEKVPAFDIQHSATAHLALLAALEGRFSAAAEIVGYSEAIYAPRSDRPGSQ